MTLLFSWARQYRLGTLLALVIGLTLIGGAIGFLTNPGKDEWYDSLIKSNLTPPGWVFGVVWPILYIMIGVLAWAMLGRAHHPGYPRARNLFIAQMAMNWAWSFLFFTWHLTLIAFVWLIALVGVVALTLRALWPLSRLAAGLLVPYLLWLGFATYLAGTIWWLNPVG